MRPKLGESGLLLNHIVQYSGIVVAPTAEDGGDLAVFDVEGKERQGFDVSVVDDLVQVSAWPR